MMTFKDLKFVITPLHGKPEIKLKRAQILFENGFGASVIEYSNVEGISYEIGILSHTNNTDVKFSHSFDGPIVAKLSPSNVTKKLNQIQEYLNHGTNRKNENRSERPIEQSGDETEAYNF